MKRSFSLHFTFGDHREPFPERIFHSYFRHGEWVIYFYWTYPLAQADFFAFLSCFDRIDKLVSPWCLQLPLTFTFAPVRAMYWHNIHKYTWIFVFIYSCIRAPVWLPHTTERIICSYISGAKTSKANVLTNSQSSAYHTRCMSETEDCGYREPGSIVA